MKFKDYLEEGERGLARLRKAEGWDRADEILDAQLAADDGRAHAEEMRKRALADQIIEVLNDQVDPDADVDDVIAALEHITETLRLVSQSSSTKGA
jgi:hypothetical protein